MAWSQQRIEDDANRSRRAAEVLKKGDKVWLNLKNINVEDLDRFEREFRKGDGVGEDGAEAIIGPRRSRKTAVNAMEEAFNWHKRCMAFSFVPGEEGDNVMG
ncbi:hypothetical protein P152DRAFT_499384 [Eremomyces bilateralis CBS 781.70]|uniref:Uncharacterized protein n=1 Tax=Eremomyces bilateralis CBS 781.70 TaxID=1392243 RepID=A0A6G1FQK5_9PEZI|nr:uncharacterized protein P152DRAFT_499384 [Eremomyces bilateralis CBS 781.70]KAF1808077.1 hypothetical protein P152DRAFT_499384 [Eremomyces bilateralis CBS 781.70]